MRKYTVFDEIMDGLASHLEDLVPKFGEGQWIDWNFIELCVQQVYPYQFIKV